ncbi:MAG: class I SAM-dependent methyltransferase [Candidatus Kapabacteria bacterium]|nr:class I SAM-dependent methyltransferase [Candidatus Kapabacteria bacterium]
MIKIWKLKAIVQKTISYLPYSNKINYIFQKFVTKAVHLNDDYFYDRLVHARDHINFFTEHGNSTFPNTCLEIGTGWYPVVPISFFLVGSNKIYSVDITQLLTKKRLKIAIEKIIESNSNGKLEFYINYIPQRFEILKDIFHNFDNMALDEILLKLNIEYLIEDARKLSLPDDSIDLINSNNTFEHIYPEILIPILKDFKRVLNKNGGIMSHFIDMSDHFANFDKTINKFNFLKYSDKQWKWIDNSIQPQNRLRIYDYKKIYQDLEIPISFETFEIGNLDDFNTIKLDAKFLAKANNENAIIQCHFVSLFN